MSDVVKAALTEAIRSSTYGGSEEKAAMIIQFLKELDIHLIEWDSNDKTKLLSSEIPLRDYFAIHAPIDYHRAISIFSKMEDEIAQIELNRDGTGWPKFLRFWGELRYNFADAMLKARSQACVTKTPAPPPV